MSAVWEFLFPTPEAGLAWGLALIAFGLLIQEWVRRELDDRRDAHEQDLVVSQDQAIQIVMVEPDPRELRVWSDPTGVPAQRVTNGEDLLGGDFR